MKQNLITDIINKMRPAVIKTNSQQWKNTKEIT